MIAIDTNLLLFAHDSLSPFHAAGKRYFEGVLRGNDLVGLPLPCVHGFLRLITAPSEQRSSLGYREALSVVEEWLSFEHVRVLSAGDAHMQILDRLVRHTQAQGRFISDAAIAAIAVEHDAVVHTHDGGFARFGSLVRWLNPLASL